jgi:adenylate kinase
LETYEKNTAPLLEYYERSGRLARVNGTGNVGEIFAEIEKLI